MIKEFFTDVINQVGIDGIETLIMLPDTNGNIIISANDAENLYVDALSKKPIKDITGKIGINDIKVLKGLFNTAAFQNGDISVSHRDINGTMYPETILFKSGRTTASFRLMNKDVVKDIDKKSIPWDLQVSLLPSKIVEFDQLSRLYKDISKYFKIRSEDDCLMVDFGVNSSSTHSGTMVLHEGIESPLLGESEFVIDRFISILKKSQSPILKINTRGILGVSVETDIATYDYLLRKKL